MLGDEGAAEECVNDAWLEAWNRIPPHEPRDYLFAFLARIVRAKALNRVKALSAGKRSAEFVSLTDELAGMLRSSQNTEETVEAGALYGLNLGSVPKGELDQAIRIIREWADALD